MSIEFFGFVEWVVAIFKSVPNVVWSGLIASVVALGGVFLAGKNSARQLNMQLIHDSSEKSIERSFKLRQDVYMLVAAEMISAQNSLANLPIKDLINENPANGASEFFGVAAQCQLVASPKTAKLMMDFGYHFGQMHMRAISSIGGVVAAQIEATSAKKTLDQDQIEVDRLLLKMATSNQTINDKDTNHEVLNNYVNFFMARIEKAQKEQMEALDRKKNCTMIYARDLVRNISDIASIQVEVLVSMRSDLGFESDIEEYRKKFIEQHQKVLQDMESAFEKMA